ncbi:MAG: Gfo/Idh/MocA family oxidoreductase [Fusobacteriaceae bacterium]|jgi:predicted dehydrogenase|nr:Gfo/Idh/MocA family oxidoreductase [Fusobacteriaceae bacterium]
MKIGIIGLGSMGKRRIRLIKENFDATEIFGVDISEDRRNEVNNLFNITTYESIDLLLENHKIESVFICTSPLSHSNIILNLLEKNINIFTELNLVDDNYKMIMENSSKKGLLCFLSSTMLYRKEIEFIEKKIQNSNEKIAYRYHVGQYLPDWHPWEKYKDFFVGNKRTNGCRELLAIELPWIIKIFGIVKKMTIIKDKISKLNLNYDDIYLLMLEHENGCKGMINVDVVSREAIRNLEIYSENLHIFWNGTPNSLEIYNINTKNREKINLYKDIEQDSRYAKNIIENAYLEEIREFFETLKSKNREPRYGFKDDLYIISLMNRIEGI